jgi:hypothetical protein
MERTLTISEKGKLLDVLDRGVKQADAAAEFGISKATVSRIWKLKDSIRQDLASSHASVLEVLYGLCSPSFWSQGSENRQLRISEIFG